MASTTSTTYPLNQTNVPYSDVSSLNTLSVYLPRAPTPKDPNRIFIIYTHGGAWRDPLINAASLAKTQQHLLQVARPELQDAISGIATLDYRLSPYPSHPTSPSNPHDPSRTARHPDHITDVLRAILYLQETYAFGSRYILIGHSCGATLALQTAIKRYWGAQYESTLALELNVEPPQAIIAVEGIYDIPGLVDQNSAQPAYRDLVVNAFGSDRSVWESASPVKGDYEEGWEEGRLVVLVHSEADELVGMEQADAMWRVFGEQGFEEQAGSARRRRFLKLQGLKHDEVWEDGEELAKIIAETVEDIVGGSTG
ncbi:hypothetical protein Q7P37_002499 [Cladosporium fusiforme]